MPREHSDLQKHTLNLYQGDMDELRALFPGVEPSRLIRDLVRDLIRKAKAGDPKETPPLNIEVQL